MPCKNPCRLLHPSCIHILRWSLKCSVKRTRTGSAFFTNESAWSGMVTGSQSCVWIEVAPYTNARGEPTSGNRCTGLMLKSNRLKFKASGKTADSLTGIYRAFIINLFKTNRSRPLVPKNLLGHWLNYTPMSRGGECRVPFVSAALWGSCCLCVIDDSKVKQHEQQEGELVWWETWVAVESGVGFRGQGAVMKLPNHHPCAWRRYCPSLARIVTPFVDHFAIKGWCFQGDKEKWCSCSMGCLACWLHVLDVCLL
jgi:hypothetical protein